MKKLTLLIVFFIAGSFACKAQNEINVSLIGDVCINKITINYASGTDEIFDLGCSDDFNLNLSQPSKSVISVVVNGYLCKEGETEVFLDGGKKRKVITGHEESKGPFSNIVVR